MGHIRIDDSSEHEAMIDTSLQEMPIRPSVRPVRVGSARRLAAVASTGMALALAACSSGGNSTSPATNPAPATTGGASGSVATTGTIVIRNFTFSPSTTRVSPGATLTVHNEDQVAHTITSSKGGFSTGDIQPGQSKTFTAPTTAGSYPYICSIHQYMSGAITVS
jgi:plastocyanin